MSSLVRAASPAIAAAARALVSDPEHLPADLDPEIRSVLQGVVDGLDAYEQQALDRARAAKDATSLAAFEALLARRIMLEVNSLPLSEHETVEDS